MEENKNTEQIPYEELANNFIALRQEYFKMHKTLSEYERSNYFTQLGILIEIVKASDKFPKEFVDRCVNEIINMMTPEENANEESKEE